MKETIEYVRLLDRVSNAVNKLPAIASTEAVNFSKERFRDQNWVDNTTQAWPKRTNDKKPGRAVLVKTARLKRSIRKVSVTSDSAIIGPDVPYAQAHNDGFRGRVKQNVRSHTRHTKRGEVQVRSHSRSANINLPRRRFIGASAILDKRLTRVMTAHLIRAIKG
jgi:phage gpG-like protein